MTPGRAIKAECKRCLNSTTYSHCNTMTCGLQGKTTSALRRIKQHCIECSPEQTIYGAKACDGRLLDGTMCVLHQYRDGHDPKRKGKNPAHLVPFQRKAPGGAQDGTEEAR